MGCECSIRSIPRDARDRPIRNDEGRKTFTSEPVSGEYCRCALPFLHCQSFCGGLDIALFVVVLSSSNNHLPILIPQPQQLQFLPTTSNNRRLPLPFFDLLCLHRQVRTGIFFADTFALSAYNSTNKTWPTRTWGGVLLQDTPPRIEITTRR